MAPGPRPGGVEAECSGPTGPPRPGVGGTQPAGAAAVTDTPAGGQLGGLVGPEDSAATPLGVEGLDR
jgi:hypothetical protein